MSHSELELLIRILTSQPPLPLDVRAQREGFEKFAVFAPVPIDGRCSKLDAGGVAAEFVAAPGADADRTVLYLHGGGYAIGSIATHRLLAYNLSRASGARCLVLDYRLAPEQPFPAALDDATTAYRWLLAQGHAASHIAIAGDSAGGGLAVASLLRLRDEGAALPAMGLCLSPWTDLAATGDSLRRCAASDPLVTTKIIEWMAGLYAGQTDRKHPYLSPLYANLKGLPPLTIQVSSTEALLDDSLRLAERAHAAGVKVNLEVAPNMLHVWQLYALMLGEAREAIGRAGQAIRSALG